MSDDATVIEEEIKPEEIVKEETPKSMDDTIRESLREIESRETPEEPEEKAARIRDEKGKFAGKDDLSKPVESVTEAPIEATVPPEVMRLGLRKDEAEEFAKAPENLRNVLLRRSEEMHKGIEQYRQGAQFGQSMERAMTPYLATIQSLGISPDKAVSELMAADDRLRNGSPQEKLAYIYQLAQNYRIDLGQMPDQPQIDPNISHISQEVKQLRDWINQKHQQDQERNNISLNSEIANFASDPNHSHFGIVQEHMSELLQDGRAKDLQDAYEQAIWANHTTRQAMLDQQVKAQREEAAKKAQAAKEAASVNTPRRPSMPVSQPIGSMDETIRQTLRRLQGS